MKKSVVVCFALLLLFGSCSQPEKDKGIKETIASAAKQELAFAGVNYVVENGVVTLTGNAPTEKERSKVEEKVKDLSGVKKVINQIVVAPVVLSADHSMKQSVDSILKKYPTVQAIVKDSVITVQGKIDSKKAVKLFSSLQKLQAKGVANELVITSVSQDENAAK